MISMTRVALWSRTSPKRIALHELPERSRCARTCTLVVIAIRDGSTLMGTMKHPRFDAASLWGWYVQFPLQPRLPEPRTLHAHTT